MNLFKKFKILLLLIFLVYIGIIIRGCFSENIRHSLDLSIDVQGTDLCIYTNNHNHFLDENNEKSYFLVGVKVFDFNKNMPISIFDEQIFLNDRIFPFKKEDCILIPLSKFELNTPYAFIIHTEKSFTQRVCILRNKEIYKIKKVYSMENCEH